MNTSREAIYAALFARVQAMVSATDPTPSGYIRTASRVLAHWDDVMPELMPYVGQVQVGESPQQQRGMPGKWALSVELYIYVSTNLQQDQSVVPASLLNPILDRLENVALAADSAQAQNVCTLGGLVSHCWISGAIQTSEGWLGNKEVAIVPIEILVPN